MIHKSISQLQSACTRLLSLYPLTFFFLHKGNASGKENTINLGSIIQQQQRQKPTNIPVCAKHDEGLLLHLGGSPKILE